MGSYADLQNRHPGARFAVLGTGPSLAAFAQAPVPDCLTIGSNGIGHTWQPDYYCIIDPVAYRVHQEIFNSASGSRLLASWVTAACDVILPLSSEREVGFSPAAPYHGRNVSYVALQVAAFLGASEIHFFGVDGYARQGPVYHHSMPKWYERRSRRLWNDRFNDLTQDCFRLAAAELARREVLLVNHSPRSFLASIPWVREAPACDSG